MNDNVLSLILNFRRDVDCDITDLPRKHYSYTTTWAMFQKDSPYLRLFNYHINRSKENGVHQRTLKIYEKEKECPNFVGQPIGFENCIDAFLVIGIGIGTAILVMIAETIQKKFSFDKSKAEEICFLPSTNGPMKDPSKNDEAYIEVVSIEDLQL